MKKNHKRTIYTIKSIFLLLIPLLLVILATSKDHTITNAEDTEEVVVTPKFKPSDPPKKFLGMWSSSGYNLQPQSDYYTSIGETVTIRTNTVRSVGGVISGAFDSPHFRWWKSTDGKNWTEVNKNDNGQKKNFSVTPTQAGTVWYQLDTQYYKYITWWAVTHLYSQVTAVHTATDPVDALSLEITLDDDYLYYGSDSKDENTTHAHAHPDPVNSTGQITWSIDRPDLATIDADGQILANNNGLSGTVAITATMNNPNGSIITSNTVYLEVGGGLDDQIVNSGETATYTLKGDTLSNPDDDDDIDSITIEWFKYAPNSSTGISLGKTNETSYTTPENTIADDGSHFQAVIVITSGKKTKTIRSNLARLTVIPAGDPDIIITNKIVNKTYINNLDNDNLLYNVTGGDNIIYQDTLTNTNTEALLKNGSYTIPLHAKTQVNSITVNGQILSPDDYSILPDIGNNSDNLIINIGTIDVSSQKNIEVDTTVPDILQRRTFKFTPYLNGTDNDNNDYQQFGTDETINYITDKITPNIQNLDYGFINAFSKGTLKYRQDDMNMPNYVIEIDDQRRDKHGMNVFVSQENDFTDNQGNVLSANLRHYENDNYAEITGLKTPIAQSNTGDVLGSIGWQKNDGLLLYINGNNLTAGTYSTTLTWYFENSI